MVKQKMIITGCYNRHPYDKTKWYALIDEEHWLNYYKPIERIAKWDNQNR